MSFASHEHFLKRINEDKEKVFNTMDIVSEYKNFEQDSGCEILENEKRRYSCKNILTEFLEGTKYEDLFMPLISPEQYEKALSEYVKYGELLHFPHDIVYRMLGIVVRNSVLIINSSQMLYTFEYFSRDFFKNEILPLYQKEYEQPIEITDDDIVICHMTPEEFTKKYKFKTWLQFKYAMMFSKCNKKYTDWEAFPVPWDRSKLSQWTALMDGSVVKLNNEIRKNFPRLCPGINSSEMICPFFDKEKNEVIIKQRYFTVVFDLGLVKWLKYGYTEQMGLGQIFSLLKTLKNDMSPEEALVFVNKMLDVYHVKSDMSNLFIKGGVEVLDKISKQKPQN